MTRRDVIKTAGGAGLVAATGTDRTAALAENEDNNPEQESPRLVADTIFTNGQVLTVDEDLPPEEVIARDGDPAFTIADSVAVQDNIILGVGNPDFVMRYRGPDTEVIDLQDRTILPGFIDTHGHLVDYAKDTFGEELVSKFEQPLLDGFDESKEAGLQQLEKLAEDREDGEIITAEGRYFWSNLTRKTSAQDLTEVAPNNPVYIKLGYGSWAGYINTLAYEILQEEFPTSFGVGRRPEESPDQHVFDYVQNVDEPSGFIVTPLRQGADRLWWGQPVEEEFAPALLNEYNEWVKFGWTTYSSKQTGWEQRVINTLDNRGELPIRAAYSHEGFGRGVFGLEALPNSGRLEEHGTEKMWSVGINLEATDPGANRGICLSVPVEERTVLDSDPWTSEFRPHGFCKIEEQDYHRQIVKETARLGMRIAGVHSAGDRATKQLLDLYEEAAEEFPGGLEEFRKMRYAVDHATVVSQELIPKAVDLGVSWSVGPKYIADGTFEEISTQVNEEFAHNRIVPLRSMVEGGLRIAGEVDDDREQFNLDGNTYWNGDTMVMVWQMVTRNTHSGQVVGEHEAIDRITALYAWTRWAAEYVLRENDLGTIEPGKRADLMVLDDDFLTVSDDQLKDINIVLTMMNGETVWDSSKC